MPKIGLPPVADASLVLPKRQHGLPSTGKLEQPTSEPSSTDSLPRQPQDLKGRLKALQAPKPTIVRVTKPTTVQAVPTKTRNNDASIKFTFRANLELCLPDGRTFTGQIDHSLNVDSIEAAHNTILAWLDELPWYKET